MTYAIGECCAIMRTLEPQSFQMCVTSPPYWGLRDYGHAEQLGLEPTPAEYVANMVDVFREVRRVLRDDGTVWLNIGDTYNADSATTGRRDHGSDAASVCLAGNTRGAQAVGNRTVRGRTDLKPKDLCGIPWRLAFALQADGWWLRQDIIWAKPNPMPESVTDRCTKSHEYLFLLSKSERYFYDKDAIAEPAVFGSGNSHFTKGKTLAAQSQMRPVGQGPRKEDDGTRNARSVWTIPTQPYPGSHFATMPPALAERCILAGSRIGDTVLDPFLGSGTVGMVAERNGRKWFGCELNPAYEPLIKQRTAQRGLFTEVA